MNFCSFKWMKKLLLHLLDLTILTSWILSQTSETTLPKKLSLTFGEKSYRISRETETPSSIYQRTTQ